MSDVNDDHALYEIVELSEGEVGLCRVGEDKSDADPLVLVSFSEESRYFLGDHAAAVAKAMIEAGLEAVQELQDAEDEALEGEEDEGEEVVSHLIH